MLKADLSRQHTPPRALAVMTSHGQACRGNPVGHFNWFASFILILVVLSVSGQVQGFNPARIKIIDTFLAGSRSASKTLPNKTVIELAGTSRKPGGTAEVGKTLGKMNLPNEVLEDTYARILVQQDRIERSEAEGWLRRLSGVEGFRAAMRKCSSANEHGFVGHVNEIRIADNAAYRDFRVKGIGVPFKDPLKAGVTDIDVILVKGLREIVIEAKSYPSTTPIPLISFRADMATLAEYRKANPGKEVLAVFQITEMPSDPNTRRLLEEAAKNHGVELIYDNPAGLIEQIALLP